MSKSFRESRTWHERDEVVERDRMFREQRAYKMHKANPGFDHPRRRGARPNSEVEMYEYHS
jgi:hypothetical protein